MKPTLYPGARTMVVRNKRWYLYYAPETDHSQLFSPGDIVWGRESWAPVEWGGFLLIKHFPEYPSVGLVQAVITQWRVHGRT